MVQLPIDLIAERGAPRRFRWRQTLNTPIGTKTIEHEGALPPNVDEAVEALVRLVKRQAQEIEELKRINDGFADRIAAQSEVLSRAAEKPHNSSSRGGKGK